ncbi:MAG: ATP synthase F0 subunit C [Microscillaceae bacterium]|nr:ATP synthase F0 subunit C [Microscillaceae bacterium]
MLLELLSILLADLGMGLAGVGAGLVALGTGLGIGQIGGRAMDAIARQPESTPRIQGVMIIAAALIEGVALFGVVICLIIAVS